MRHVSFKENCRIKKLTPALLWIFNCLDKIQNIYFWVPDLVITSVNDSQHMSNSRHYTDEAVDLRIWNFDPKDIDPFIIILDTFLNKDPEVLKPDGFTVIRENDHIHIQVKKNGTYP